MATDRRMTIALLVSAALHISMVTLFSIGIWFPVEKRIYHRFEIREDPLARPAATSQPRLDSLDTSLDLPEVPDMLGREQDQPESLLDLGTRVSSLPTVELPTFGFTEFQRLELQSEALDARSRLDTLRAERQRDSWSRLGSELSRLGDALVDLNPFHQPASQPDEAFTPAGPVQLAAPAPGFEAYIDWLSGDDERDVLLSPSIDALRDVDPRDWQEPMSVVLKVNRRGQVVEIMSPLDPDSPLMARIWRSILGYRFEPVGEEAPEIQHGTLFIAATPETP